MPHHGLGRRRSPRDSRDWTVPMLKTRLKEGLAEPVSWDDPVVLNQGETQHCVGYGSAAYIATKQKKHSSVSTIRNKDGERIYYECKVRDAEPREENGSYVRTGAKVLQKDEKVITNYAFGSFEDGKEWVEQNGPTVIGIDWYEGMYKPEKDGVIRPSGELMGGHCILWRGTNIKIPGRESSYNLLRNSWGKEWGKDGDCYISDSNLRILIDKYGGECMMAVKPVGGTTPKPQGKSFWAQMLDYIREIVGR